MLLKQMPGALGLSEPKKLTRLGASVVIRQQIIPGEKRCWGS